MYAFLLNELLSPAIIWALNKKKRGHLLNARADLNIL